MTARITITLSPILLVVVFSCEQESTAYKRTTADGILNREEAVVALATDARPDTAAAPWLSPKAMTPFSFLETMKKKSDNALGVITMTDNFPDNWVRKEDVAELLKLMDSQQKCSCFMNPLSSSIPKGKATVGGYATTFVEAYKEKRRVSFGLHACPTADKQKTAALRKWWETQRK